MSARRDYEELLASDLLEVEKRAQQQANWLLAVTVVVIISIAELQEPRFQEPFRSFSLALSGTLVVWFVGSALLIRAGHYRPWFKYVNVVIQVSTVTFFLLASVRLMGAEFALSSSAPVLYVLVIGVSSLTLNPMLSLLAGGFAAGQFVGAYWFWLYPGLGGGLRASGANGWTGVAIKAVVFLAMGIGAMLMARKARALLEQVVVQVRAEESLRALEEDMQRAGEVQERLIPKRPTVAPPLTIEACYRPSREVGGDYFDVLQGPQGRCFLVMGDVSGKGYAAALTMASIQAVVRLSIERGGSLEDLAGTLNRSVSRSSVRGGFVSLAMMEVKPAEDCIRYINCGHNPPLVWDPSGQLHSLPPQVPVLGVVTGVEYQVRSVPFVPGALLFAYTDGLSELRDARGRELGAEALEALIRAHAGAPVSDLKRAVLAIVDRHLAGAAPGDDLSFVCLRRT